ncbi:MAG: hypothetical protein ACTSQA_01380 [Candidatus Heimdallarchaeaceae archaeon]
MDSEATTSTPEKEESTPQGDKEAITSEKSEVGESTPPEKTVEELKAEVEQLRSEVEKSQTLQSQADKKARIEKVTRLRIEEKLKKIRSGEIEVDDLSGEANTGNVPVTDVNTALEIKAGIQGIIIDNPSYQEVLKKDQTLKQVLLRNPLALIEDCLDAEDAVEQIKDLFDTKVSALKEEVQPKEQNKGNEGKKFEVGATQPAETSGDNSSSEESNVTPTDKIEKSILSKIKVEK